MVDVIDRRFLAALVADGRITLHELAERVHLGASATRERLRRLEGAAIRGYAALADPAVLGFPLEAVIEVDLPPNADVGAFEAALQGSPQVVEALHATGEHDYLVRLRCTDTGDLHETIRGLKARHGAARTQTSVVLDEVVPLRQRLP